MKLPARAQVVVVGAGFAGASTAYHLAAGGIRDVLVLEREAIAGHHASGRNAAQCRVLVEDETATELTARGAAFLREPPPGFSRAPLLRQTGGLLSSSRSEVLAGIAARAAARRLPHERVGPGWIAERWPRLAGLPTRGGVLFPEDGVIDIHALLQGFLEGARARGVRVALSCPVSGIRSGRDGTVFIETGAGTVEADCLVNGAGAWAEELGRLAGASPPRLTPIHRHLHVTGPVPDLAPDLPFAWHLDREDEFYVRPEGGGLLLSGCDAVEAPPGDARVTPGATDELAAKLTRLCPRLAELAVVRSWACLRTFAGGGRPVLGWDGELPWLFWVAGLGGHGATSAPAVGEAAARAIAARLA